MSGVLLQHPSATSQPDCGDATARARRKTLLTQLAWRAPRLLVVDFEMTCGPGVLHAQQDIIEVGLCLLEVGALPGDPQSLLIRPTRSPVTKFCTKLTGIAWPQVKNKPPFPPAARKLSALAADLRVDAWAAWGADDNVLHRQCVGLNIANPFGHLHYLNLKSLLVRSIYAISAGTRPKGSGAGVGLATAMRELAIEPYGRAHSGAADAYNAAMVLSVVRSKLPHEPRAAAADRRRDPTD